MSRLMACLLTIGGLLVAGTTLAQHRRGQGRALVVRPSRAHYYRAPIRHGFSKPSRRAHYRYAPSYHAYYNRSAYRPRIYYHRRPLGRSPVATLRPRMAGQ